MVEANVHQGMKFQKKKKNNKKKEEEESTPKVVVITVWSEKKIHTLV